MDFFIPLSLGRIGVCPNEIGLGINPSMGHAPMSPLYWGSHWGRPLF